MTQPSTFSVPIRFGPFEVSFDSGELRKNGMRLKLSGQPIQVLLILLENPGQLVSREELQQKLWPGASYGDFDQGLNAAVNRLREVLGDSAANPHYIETVPRRGYRFIAAVEKVETASDSSVLQQLKRDIETRKTSGNPRFVERLHRRGDQFVEPVNSAVESQNQIHGSSNVRAYFHDRRLLSASAGVSLVLVTTLGILFWPSKHRRQSIGSPSTLKVFPLTGALGAEQQPAFSPDGTRVAYIWQGETQGNSNLYVKLIGAGPPLRLTSNANEESFPVWSPDGLYIAFLRRTAEGSDVCIIPALGGPERKLTHLSLSYFGLDGGLSWAPDGNVLAIADKTTTGEAIFFISAADGRKWKVTSPPADSFGDFYPAFSTDGRYLAFVRSRGPLANFIGADNDIFLQDIGSNAKPNAAPTRLTFDNVWVPGLDWTADGRAIVFSSIRSGRLRLWRIDPQALSQKSNPEPVPAGDDAAFPAVSRKLGRLAYQQLKGTAFISELELSAARKNHVANRFCPSSLGQVSPQFSPDGTRVVFASFRSGNLELWLCKSDGSSPIQLTSLGSGMVGSPAWSPDGRKVAFDYGQGGHVEIRVLSLEQNLSVRVTPPDFNGTRPIWSGDGKWIYFNSAGTGDWQVWKVPSDGGTPMQITRQGGWEGRESPDGRDVYYVKYYPDWVTNPARTPGIWKVPVGGGEESRLLEHGKPGLWTVSERGIYVLTSLPRGTSVELFDPATQRLTRIATLPEDTRLDTDNPAFTISPDGRKALYGQLTYGGNVMVVDNFR